MTQTPGAQSPSPSAQYRRAGSEKAGLELRLEHALVVEENPVVPSTILDPRQIDPKPWLSLPLTLPSCCSRVHVLGLAESGQSLTRMGVGFIKFGG